MLVASWRGVRRVRVDFLVRAEKAMCSDGSAASHNYESPRIGRYLATNEPGIIVHRNKMMDDFACDLIFLLPSAGTVEQMV